MRIRHYRGLYGRGEFGTQDRMLDHYYDFRLGYEHLFVLELESSKYILGAVRTKRNSKLIADLVLQKEKGDRVSIHWFGASMMSSLDRLVDDTRTFLTTTQFPRVLRVSQMMYHEHEFYYVSPTAMRVASFRKAWKDYLRSLGISLPKCRFVAATRLNIHWYVHLLESFPRDVLMTDYFEHEWLYLIVVDITDHSRIFVIPLEDLYRRKCLSTPSFPGKSWIPFCFKRPTRFWTGEYVHVFPHPDSTSTSTGGKTTGTD